MGLNKVTNYFNSNKFTITLGAFDPKITCHMKVLGMVCHQPRLNEPVADRALHLAVGVLVQARGSRGPSNLGLDRGNRGRRGAGGYPDRWGEGGWKWGCHWKGGFYYAMV